MADGNKYELDLGQVRMTGEEIDERIQKTTNGLRFGQTSDGQWGYIPPESEGADAVVPFKSGSGVGSVEIKFRKLKGLVYQAASQDLVVPEGATRAIVRTVTVTNESYSTTSTSRTAAFTFVGTRTGATSTTSLTIASCSNISGVYTEVKDVKTDYEIDFSGYDAEKEMVFRFSVASGSTGSVYASMNATIEFFF